MKQWMVIPCNLHVHLSNGDGASELVDDGRAQPNRWESNNMTEAPQVTSDCQNAKVFDSSPAAAFRETAGAGGQR